MKSNQKNKKQKNILFQSALIVSLANIQIPLLLGEIVNVVARFTGEHTEEGNNYIKEITVPTVKIIKFYVAQVEIIVAFFLYIRSTVIDWSLISVYFIQGYEKLIDH